MPDRLQPGMQPGLCTSPAAHRVADSAIVCKRRVARGRRLCSARSSADLLLLHRCAVRLAGSWISRSALLLPLPQLLRPGANEPERQEAKTRRSNLNKSHAHQLQNLQQALHGGVGKGASLGGACQRSTHRQQRQAC